MGCAFANEREARRNHFHPARRVGMVRLRDLVSPSIW
jgi:hypothetical protein